MSWVDVVLLCRDFTNPYLPCEGGIQPPQVAGMGAAGHGMAQHYGEQQQHYGGPPVGMDPSRSNVLLVYIDDVEYTPTLDALHTVFKTYGHVQKMTIFEKGGHWQVRLQTLVALEEASASFSTGMQSCPAQLAGGCMLSFGQ